jgi:hypothetical protein
MSKFTTYANDILDLGFNNGASGTATVGATTYTYPVKAELTTTVSTAGTPGTLVSGGSYAAQTLGGNFATAAAAAAKASTGALTYSNMPACTWADVYLRDSTGTPKPMNFRGGSSLAKTVNAGDTALIPIGSLTGSET